MSSPNPSHNPLSAAAKELAAAAQAAKSPLLERIATWTLISSALGTLAIAGMQLRHMIRREQKEEERERERERRAEAALPPSTPQPLTVAQAPEPHRRWTGRTVEVQAADADQHWAASVGPQSHARHR